MDTAAAEEDSSAVEGTGKEEVVLAVEVLGREAVDTDTVKSNQCNRSHCDFLGYIF